MTGSPRSMSYGHAGTCAAVSSIIKGPGHPKQEPIYDEHPAPAVTSAGPSLIRLISKSLRAMLWDSKKTFRLMCQSNPSGDIIAPAMQMIQMIATVHIMGRERPAVLAARV